MSFQEPSFQGSPWEPAPQRVPLPSLSTRNHLRCSSMPSEGDLSPWEAEALEDRYFGRSPHSDYHSAPRGHLRSTAQPGSRSSSICRPTTPGILKGSPVGGADRGTSKSENEGGGNPSLQDSGRSLARWPVSHEDDRRSQHHDSPPGARSSPRYPSVMGDRSGGGRPPIR